MKIESVAKPRGGNGMDGGAVGMGEEPGETDNRLSLNPNDPAWQSTLAEWKDGQRYKVTLEVDQISPGEFEVISLNGQPSGGAAEEDSEALPEEGGEAGNPAFEAMLSEE